MSNIWVIFILLVNSGKYWIINRNISGNYMRNEMMYIYVVKVYVVVGE